MKAEPRCGVRLGAESAGLVLQPIAAVAALEEQSTLDVCEETTWRVRELGQRTAGC